MNRLFRISSPFITSRNVNRIIRCRWSACSLSTIKSINDCIDLSNYPLHEPNSKRYKELVSSARASLAKTGCTTFPQFLTQDALTSVASEVAAISSSAFEARTALNAYQLIESDPRYPPNHARNNLHNTHVASIAYDELCDVGPLKRVYASNELIDFLSCVLGQRLHRLADPLGACTVNIYRPGWGNGWHFDEAEFTTTICLQQPERGGEFDFTPPLRSTSDEFAFEAVESVLTRTQCDTAAQNRSPVITTAPFAPGTLQLFAGRYSLHRVRPVCNHATNERIVAVLCFASEPGLKNSPYVQKMFWGRVA